MKALMTALVLCLLLAMAGCGGDDDSSGEGSQTTRATTAAESGDGAQKQESGESNQEPEENIAERSKPATTVPRGTPPKQLVEELVLRGIGPATKAGDEVTVNYVGYGWDTREEFDSSWDRDEPFSFQLGAGQVIPGWEKGVEGMRVGMRRKLTIPPNLAYGATGSPPAIGPNETLIFTIDLVAIN